MKSTFRCMTFNLRVAVTVDGPNYWPHRLHAVLTMIRKHKPDFLGTQEVTDGMAKDLEKPLSDYASCGDGRDADRHGERCSLFVLKKNWTIEHTETIWLSTTPELPGSGDPEEGYPRICTMALVKSAKDNSRFLLLNVHLAYRSERAKTQNIETLVQAIDRWEKAYACPMILMGDFNATPDHPIHRILKENHLTDAHDILPTNKKSTFHGFQGGIGLETIDYIYHTEKMKCVSWDVDQTMIHGRYPSDHFPVIADLVLK